jgi:UPF0716 protein FxsA
MRLLVLLMILLAFPILELALLFELGSRYGWWLLGYLVSAAACGWLLIMDERLVVFGRMMRTMQQGSHPATALLASAKKVIAGVLLILPGVVSDVIALLLLLAPLPSSRQPPAANDDVIEGEWRRED